MPRWAWAGRRRRRHRHRLAHTPALVGVAAALLAVVTMLPFVSAALLWRRIGWASGFVGPARALHRYVVAGSYPPPSRLQSPHGRSATRTRTCGDRPLLHSPRPYARIRGQGLDGGVTSLSARTGASSSGSGSNNNDDGDGGGGQQQARGDSHAAGADGGIRVNKCFVSFASRREADKFVAAGRVRINGKVAEPGARIVPGDAVTLDGKPVRWEKDVFLPDDEGATAEARGGRRGEGAGGQPKGRELLYIKYWKPRGVICTTDESVRGNIVSALDLQKRIFPVGRLDKDSTGLILLTNDGRLPNAVLRSSLNHRKTYKVRLNRPITDPDIDRLRKGVVITTPVQRDRVDKLLTAKTLPCEVERVGARVFEIVLREGRNRQIRRMAEALGYRVVDLHREKVMDIDLRGLRGEGDWARLDRGEMGMVSEALRVYEAAVRAARAARQGAEGSEGEEDNEEE